MKKNSKLTVLDQAKAPDYPPPPVELDPESLGIWKELFAHLKSEKIEQGVDSALALSWVLATRAIRSCFRGLAGQDIVDPVTGLEHPLSIVAGKKSTELLKISQMLGIMSSRKRKIEKPAGAVVPDTPNEIKKTSVWGDKL